MNCLIVEFTLIMTTNYSNQILEDQINQFQSQEDNLLIKLNSQKLTYITLI